MLPEDHMIPREENLPQQKKIERKHSSGFVHTYSNSAQIIVTPWDIQCVFGEITHADGETLFVEDSAHVTMSPAHAKVFALVLQDKIKEFEGTFGAITHPHPRLAAASTEKCDSGEETKEQ